MALKVGRMVVFTALATAARHVLACRWRQSTPQSYAFTSDCLHSPLVFELEQSGRRDSLDLLTKVKYREQGGEEEEWRVLESVVNYWLLAVYNQFFKATDHLLGLHWTLHPYTLHSYVFIF